jgi:hypothetical protein
VTSVDLAAEKASIVLEKILALGISKLCPDSHWLLGAAGGSRGMISPGTSCRTITSRVGIGGRTTGMRGGSTIEILAVIEIPGN